MSDTLDTEVSSKETKTEAKAYNAYEPAYTDVTFTAKVNDKVVPVGTTSFSREEAHPKFDVKDEFISG